MNSEQSWDLVIKPKSKWYHLRLREIVRYRDLLLLFVRRDFVSTYKQTILGPIWFFVQPIITTITFTIIFGRLAGISTDGVPHILFYLSGLTIWTYFADTLTKTSDTFIANANLFGKVYFPRLVVPLSVVVSNLTKLGVQMLLFLAVWLYFFFATDKVKPNAALLLVPLLILLMGVMGLAFGILITSMTTKYRDLKFLIAFGVQIMMYASPIIFPTSSVPADKRWILFLNPVSSIIETFKYAFIGVGEFSWLYLGYTLLFTTILLIVGLIVFHRVEKSFTDTV